MKKDFRKVQLKLDIFDNLNKEKRFNKFLDDLISISNHYIHLIYTNQLPHKEFLSSKELPDTQWTTSSAQKRCAYKNASKILEVYKNNGITDINKIKATIDNIILDSDLFDIWIQNTEKHDYSDLNDEYKKKYIHDNEIHPYEVILKVKLLDFEDDKHLLKSIKIPYHAHKFFHRYLYNKDYKLQNIISFSRSKNNKTFLNLYFMKETEYQSGVTCDISDIIMQIKIIERSIRKDKLKEENFKIQLQNIEIEKENKEIEKNILKKNREKRSKKQCFNCQKFELILTHNEIKNLILPKLLINNNIKKQIEYYKSLINETNIEITKLKNDPNYKFSDLYTLQTDVSRYEHAINLISLNLKTTNEKLNPEDLLNDKTHEELKFYLKNHFVSEENYNEILNYFNNQIKNFKPTECKIRKEHCEHFKELIITKKQKEKEYKNLKKELSKNPLISDLNLISKHRLEAINDLTKYENKIKTLESIDKLKLKEKYELKNLREFLDMFFISEEKLNSIEQLKYSPNKYERINVLLAEFLRNPKRLEIYHRIIELENQLKNDFNDITDLKKQAIKKSMLDVNYVSKDIENSIRSKKIARVPALTENKVSGVDDNRIWKEIIEKISWDGLSEVILNARGGTSKDKELEKMIIKACHEKGILVSTYKGYSKCKCCGGDTFEYHNGIRRCRCCGTIEDMTLNASFTLKTVTNVARYKRTIKNDSVLRSRDQKKSFKRSVTSTING